LAFASEEMVDQVAFPFCAQYIYLTHIERAFGSIQGAITCKLHRFGIFSLK
jgi:hypothetical protein